MSRLVRLAATTLWLLAGRAEAQRVDVRCDPGDTEVRRLTFTGNTAIPDYILERGIETAQSDWAKRTFRIFGTAACLDSAAVTLSAARLRYHYEQRGFPAVRVTPRITPLGARAVAVEFVIDEGTPMLIDSVSYEGLDDIPERAAILRSLPVTAGERFDIDSIEATRDLMTRRLRDNGYPVAEVLRSYDTDVDARRATVMYQAVPGPRSRIGAIEITVESRPGGETQIDPNRVRNMLGIREGQVYSETSLEGVKRGLYLTGAFRTVDISIDSASLQDEVDSLVTIDVSLSETELHVARVSAGWGNLDCLRAGGTYTDYNFLRSLRRLDVNARLSKVGVDPPFGFARGLCPSDVRNDPLSDTLNYYVSATLSQAALFRLRIIPSLTLYSERRSEFRAFLRETPIGILGSAQQGVDGRLPMTWSYQLEYGRTTAQPAFFCAVFNVCEEAARSRLERLTRTAVLGWSATRNRANDVVDPTYGSVVRFDIRHSSTLVGSSPDVEFNRVTTDAALYRGAFNGGSIVFRLRAGTVLGERLSISEGATSFIPLQERLYAGGPTTVRGFPQNELGPSIYLPDNFRIDTIPGTGDTLGYFRADPGSGERVVPTGGDNVVVANVELRLRSFVFPELAQMAFFVDAGQVWNRGRAGTGVNFRDIRVTPGFGVRVFTPIGPVRVDVGYNGYGRPAGPAYINPEPVGENPVGQTLRLICVSPGNALRVRLATPNHPPLQIDEGDCPATYAPARRATFLSRLTFQFSIGQPF